MAGALRGQVEHLYEYARLLLHDVGADLRKQWPYLRDIHDVLLHADIGTTQIYTHMTHEDLPRKLPRRFSG